MRTLESVTEFQAEAKNAVFTKQQAVAATLQLLDKEQAKAETPQEAAMFASAIAKAEFRYIDATKTETDRMLDGLGVARFTAEDIVNAVHMLVFDAQ